MPQYQWILFDADDTLFHFDACSGLKLMFANYGMEFGHQDYADYQRINKALWVEYQNGKLTAKDVQQRRFESWGCQLNVSPQELNRGFLQAMAEICTPMEGALKLLSALKGKFHLGLVTNGFTDLQHVRLERTNFKEFFDLVVISEEVGVAKPHRGIFDYALAVMGNPCREQVLMVGDTPETDILGGINSGLDTCWLNMNERNSPIEIKAKYEVGSLGELFDILFL